MTENKKSKLICPHCETETDYLRYVEIDVDDTPEVRRDILDMNFFTFDCPICKNRIRLTYPLCYRDEEHKILIYFTPYGHEKLAEKPTKVGYRARIVESVDDFREKIMCFERGLDDRALELVKWLLKLQYKQNGGEGLEDIFFYDIDENGNQVFIMVNEDGTEQSIATLPIYYMNILDEIERKLPEPSWECQLIDRNWAEEISDDLN